MIIPILSQIWCKRTTLALFSQIKCFFILSIQILSILYRNKIFWNFTVKFSLPKKYFSSRYVENAYLCSKNFLKNWLVWNFNSRFGSKIISSEVRLKQKFAFQTTLHKIWTYYPKNFWVIFFDSHYWILKCIQKRSFAIIFGWLKVAWAFHKVLCLGGLEF